MASSSKHVLHSSVEAYKKFGIDLTRRYLANPQNEQLRQEFMLYCRERVTAIVRYLVLGRGFCPPGPDKYAFVEDACQDVLVKILENIESLRTPENLFAWLKEISANLLTDAHRDAVGRGETPRVAVCTEVESEQGSRESIFELAEGRDAAMQHLASSLTEHADAERWTEKIHNRAVLERALAVHANSGKERDFESSLWIKETWDYPHLTAEQIAKLRNRSVGDTQHILHDDNQAIIPIVKYLIDPGAAERNWKALINDIESALGGDPASPDAAALVDRWQKLGGDLTVMEEVRKQHAEQANWPVPLQISDNARDFICRALEASRKTRKRVSSTLS